MERIVSDRLHKSVGSVLLNLRGYYLSHVVIINFVKSEFFSLPQAARRGETFLWASSEMGDRRA